MKIEWTETGVAYQSMESFREDHPDARIDALNDKECIGSCEGCG